MCVRPCAMCCDAQGDKVDQLVVGGGIANTFLAAAGHPVGKSLYEEDLIPAAKKIAEKVHIPIPVDVVTAKEFAESAEATAKKVDDVAEDDLILDIGPQTAHIVAALMKERGLPWAHPDRVADGGSLEQFFSAIPRVSGEVGWRWPII